MSIESLHVWSISPPLYMHVHLIQVNSSVTKGLTLHVRNKLVRYPNNTCRSSHDIKSNVLTVKMSLLLIYNLEITYTWSKLDSITTRIYLVKWMTTSSVHQLNEAWLSGGWPCHALICKWSDLRWRLYCKRVIEWKSAPTGQVPHHHHLSISIWISATVYSLQFVDLRAGSTSIPCSFGQLGNKTELNLLTNICEKVIWTLMHEMLIARLQT